MGQISAEVTPFLNFILPPFSVKVNALAPIRLEANSFFYKFTPYERASFPGEANRKNRRNSQEIYFSL